MIGSASKSARRSAAAVRAAACSACSFLASSIHDDSVAPREVGKKVESLMPKLREVSARTAFPRGVAAAAQELNRHSPTRRKSRCEIARHRLIKSR